MWGNWLVSQTLDVWVSDHATSSYLPRTTVMIDRGWDGWMASPTQWAWVWVNSGSWWWTGRPGVLRFMGSQRVGHDWATELNWTEQLWWRRKWLPVALQYSCLENLMNRGACQAAVQGVAKSRTWLSTLAESYEGINVTARKCAFLGVRGLAWLLQGGPIKVYHSPKLLYFRRSRWDDKMETKEKWVITFCWKSYQTHTYEDVILKELSRVFSLFLKKC